MLPIKFASICLVIGITSVAYSENAELSIASYNIRYANPGDGENVWANRKETVCEFLSSYDIFGLQEVTRAQRKDVTQAIASHNWSGVGREPRDKGESCPIFFRHDRFVKLDNGTFWLSPTPEVIGSKGWDAALPRIASWVRLNDKVSGQTFSIFNTHFDHRGAEARKHSALLIIEKVKKLHHKQPVVLMGDLNCRPTAVPYNAINVQPIESGFVLRDALDLSDTSSIGSHSTWNGFNTVAPGNRLDYIFAAGPITVKRHETQNPKTSDGRIASDHLPVTIIAALELN